MAGPVAGTFVDTSAWYAIGDPNDANAKRARGFLDRAEEERVRLHTSELVILETAALVQRQVGGRAARTFVEIVWSSPSVDVHFSDRSLADEAQRAYVHEGKGKGASLVDCHSFSLMRRLGLARAFAFDRRFHEAGFEVVP